LIKDRFNDRPKVIVTGAYKSPEWGCVDKVASLIEKVTGNVEIDPNAYTAP